MKASDVLLICVPLLVCAVIIILIKYQKILRRLEREMGIISFKGYDANKRVEKLDQEYKHFLQGYLDHESKCVGLFQRVNDVDKEIEQKTGEINSKISQIEEQLSELQGENDCLKAELEEQKKKLNFYLNIEEDSKNLVEQEDEAEHRELLEKAAAQILVQRKNSDQNKEATETENQTETDQDNPAEQEILATQPAPEGEILDSEQKRALYYMEDTQENIFITGKAGTGKSFLLSEFARTTRKSFVILAPTGIAALNVNGVTLHSQFGYNNLETIRIKDISEKNIRLKSEKQLVLRKADTIIIDEISMVRVDIFERIDKILRVVNRKNEPFGGKQIIVFGDLFQLPPIAKREEFNFLKGKYNGVYFYNSTAYANGNFKFIELNTNHRQNGDETYFQLLSRIREGKATDDDMRLLNERVVAKESKYDRLTMLLPTKAEVEKINQAHLESLETKKYSYEAEIVLDNRVDKTKRIDDVFPITSTLELKEGALVMLVANDSERRWVNGTLGLIKKLTDDCIYVSIDGKTFEVSKARFTERESTVIDDEIVYEDVFAVLQYPIVLAYAITIHKSQGMTYPNILCDINWCFAPGQAYVALSRCTSLAGLHLKSAVSLDRIQVDHDVRDFYLAQKGDAAVALLTGDTEKPKGNRVGLQTEHGTVWMQESQVENYLKNQQNGLSPEGKSEMDRIFQELLEMAQKPQQN